MVCMASEMNPQDHPIGDPIELASLYTAGALPVEAQEAFESHLASGCSACRDELARLRSVEIDLVAGVRPVDPGDDVRKSLLNRLDTSVAEGGGENTRSPRSGADPRSSEIRNATEGGTPENVPGPQQVWKQWSPDVLDGIILRRGSEQDWEPTGVEGVRVRRLFNDIDANRMTALVEMDPGAVYPPHIHRGSEECYVLRGDLNTGENSLGPGDYERRASGSHHGVQRTESGCLLLIVSSLSDEMV